MSLGSSHTSPPPGRLEMAAQHFSVVPDEERDDWQTVVVRREHRA